MAIRVVGIIVDSLTADPGAPVDGEIWYNSTANTYRARENGVTIDLQNKQALVDHVALANPHATSLEDVRSEDNTVAGDIDMGSFRLLNLGGTANTDAASRQFVLDQIKTKLAGLDWQESALDKDLSTPPVSPGVGDRYIVNPTGTGDWAGQDNTIAEWNGTTWDFSTPDNGTVVKVEDENLWYMSDGAAWSIWDLPIDHGGLLNLGNDDHTQYLLISGTRAMSGDLDMGTNNVTNVGTVDGVDVSNHSARHDPGGADALTTAAPGQGVGGGNTEGVATSLARSDHDHTIRETGGATDLTVGAIADGEFVQRSGTALVGASPGGFLAHKAGEVAAGSFAGNPKTATVTFGTPFASANYSVSLTVEGSTSFAPRVDTATLSASGFDINMGANNISGLDVVHWIAVLQGES